MTKTIEEANKALVLETADSSKLGGLIIICVTAFESRYADPE